MRQLIDPAGATAEQIRRELAGILAAGILRLRKRRLFGGDPPDGEARKSAKTAAAGLEDS